jgi:predicted RNase H-like HicB family nuclease
MPVFVILPVMLSKYLAVAMHHARYEILSDDGQFYGEIPSLDGVFATGETLEACREELLEVLEGWVALGVSLHHSLPEIDGVGIVVGEVA